MENIRSWIHNPSIEFDTMLRWWERDAYCCNPVGYFYRRGIQAKVRGFNPNLNHSMDYEFLLKAAGSVTFVKADHVLGVFRLFPGTKSWESVGWHAYGTKFGFCEKYLPTMEAEYVGRYRRDRSRHLKKVQEDEFFEWILHCWIQGDRRLAIRSMFRFSRSHPLRLAYRITAGFNKRLMPNNRLPPKQDLRIGMMR